MTIAAHAQAFLGLLDADNSPPPLVVLDGAVPSGQNPPYVLVYMTVQTVGATTAADSTDLTMDSSRVVLTGYCHCVGGSSLASRYVATRVETALLNVRPTISGRACFPIRHEESQPPRRDETTGVLVMDLVDVYRLESVPG